MSLVRQTAAAAAAAIALTASRFLLTAILARRLSMSAFGQFAYAQWLVDTAFLVCSLGATAVASRYFAEYRHDPSRLAGVADRWRPYAVGLPLVAGTVAAAAAWVSGLDLGPQAVAFLVIWAASSGLWAMQTAGLTGLQCFSRILLSNLLAGLVMICGAWLWPFRGTDAAPMFAVMAVASLTGAASSAGQVPFRRKSSPHAIDASQWRTIRYYAANMWVTALLWSLVWSRGEMPLVRAYQGDRGVAHYAAALTLLGGAVQGVMLAISGLAPHLTRLWGEGLQRKAIAAAREAMDLQLLACGVGSLLLATFSRELMGIAFGATYRGEAGILVVLSVGLVAMAVSAQNHILQIATDGRFSRNSTLVGLVVLLASAAWLVSANGLPGAAAARATAMLTLAGISLAAVRSRFGARAYSTRNLAVVLILTSSSALLLLVWPNTHWLVRAGQAVLLSSLLVAGVRDADGRMLAGVVRTRLVRRLHLRQPLAIRAPRA